MKPNKDDIVQFIIWCNDNNINCHEFETENELREVVDMFINDEEEMEKQVIAEHQEMDRIQNTRF